MMRGTTSRAIYAGMMILAFAFIGCSDDDNGGTGTIIPIDGFAEVVVATDDYLSDYTNPNGDGVNVTAQWVYDTIVSPAKAPEDYMIIDWRLPGAYNVGHIEGAVNWDLKNIIADWDLLPADKTIVNVCYSGQTASNATAIINLIGHFTGHAAVNMKFGMYGWTTDPVIVGEAGYPISDGYIEWMDQTSVDKPAAGSYPSFETEATDAVGVLKERLNNYVNGMYNEYGTGWNSRKWVDTYEVLDGATADEWFVVNYFPAGNYNAGHVPGAVRYQNTAPGLPSDLLTTTSLNTLPTDKKILVYCWTGQTSAQMTVVLNALGYEAYSGLYGVQAMCYSNAGVNGTHAYTAPLTSYETVPTPM